MPVHRTRFHSPFSLRLLRSIAQPPRQQPRSDQGLTLLESIVAIVIVTLTVVAVTPPIMLANATRVQTRRAAQANQIAQAEIDRVRSIIERRNDNLASLPAAIGSTNIANAAAPTAIDTTRLVSPSDCGRSYPTPTPAPTNQLVPVDINGDCTPEFAMQVFRTSETPPAGETVPFAFTLGVRVYAYNPSAPPVAWEVERASLVQTTGARDTLLNGNRRPLAVLYTAIARNDSSKSLKEICTQAGGSAANCPF
jgi:type II secretory pathway pseudopilin PulG